MMRFTFIILLLMFIISGCGRKTRQTLAEYINDPKHRITQTIKIGDVQATMKWMIPALLNKEEDGYSYFSVRFDKLTGEKPTKEKTLYIDFDMQQDFLMQIGKDSLRPAICQKIENGMGGSYQYVLAFDRKMDLEHPRDFGIFYFDKIFGMGDLAFVYRSNDIKKIPKTNSETR